MANVLIPLTDGSGELAAVTVIDMLRQAGINVVVAGSDPGAVIASDGAVINTDIDLDEAFDSEYDMLVLIDDLPNSIYLEEQNEIQQHIKMMAENGKFIAAISVDPQVLANAGLIGNGAPPIYPRDVEKIELPDKFKTHEAVIHVGNIVFSRDSSSAKNFSLKLIELLDGIETSSG